MPRPSTAFTRSTVRTVTLAIALALSGCAVGPNYHAPSQVGVAPPNSSGTLQGWWNTFEDPALTRLIAKAQSESPTLDQAVARVLAARAGMVSAGGSLSSSYSASYSKTGVTSDGLSRISAGGNQAINTSWEIDLFGGKSRAQEAASARNAAAILDWHASRVALAAEVSSTYLAYRNCQSSLQVVTADLAVSEKLEKLTALRANAGLESLSATEMSAITTSDSRRVIASTRYACAQQLNKLAALTASKASELTSELAGPSNVTPHVQALPTGLIPANIVASRPDVARAERNLAAASADIGVAEAALLPSLSIAGVIGINTAAPGAKSWSISPSLNIPLLNGGQSWAATLAAKAKYRESLGVWQETVLSAIQDVDDVLAHEQAARLELLEALAAKAHAVKLREISAAKYAAGAISLLDDLDSERQLLSANSTLLTANLTYQQARIALFKSAAGGWDFDTNKPTMEPAN